MFDNLISFMIAYLILWGILKYMDEKNNVWKLNNNERLTYVTIKIQPNLKFD